MNDEAGPWLGFARENLEVARMCLDAGWLNASLQNAQQAAEKALKALCVRHGMTPPRTHSLENLCRGLARAGHARVLSEDDCDRLDAIYLPSKYPLAMVAPAFEPDAALVRTCLAIAERAVAAAHEAA